VPRYRFDAFALSPRRRTLTRDGVSCPLIPRYFDLLVYLVERRGDAVPRQDIFDAVWGDVIVSDSALSQAVRTIRRVLADDSREPRYLRTVSRHGYQFVFADVREEDDAADGGPGASGPLPSPAPVVAAASVVAMSGAATAPLLSPGTTAAAPDPFAPLLDRLTSSVRGREADDDRRDAAEDLHALGTAETLTRLGTRRGHTTARALLRDTRWDVQGAGPVPIAGTPAAMATAWALVHLRLTRAAGLAATRWATAAAGGGAAGAVGGALGGLMLALGPGAEAPLTVVPVLALLGAASGAVGGGGVGAGLAVAETTMRSRRVWALVAGGAAGGAAVGLVVQWLGRWTLAALVGLTVPMGGGLDGLMLGAAAALGFALATRQATDGLAAPRGRRRAAVAFVTALVTGAAALALALAGRPLVGGTIHLVSQAFTGAHAALTPLGRLLGEPGFGPTTAALIGAAEGALFGAGLALGLTRRPHGR